MIRRNRIVALLGAYAVIIVACNLFVAYRSLAQARENIYPGPVLTSVPLLQPSLWIRDNLPDQAIIATKRIGAISYHSHRRVFDYKFGLTDKNVATLVNKHKRNFALPSDPALKDIWTKLRPDYILEDTVVIDLLAKETRGTRQRFQIHGIPYKLIKTFPISKENDWLLCQRILP